MQTHNLNEEKNLKQILEFFAILHFMCFADITIFIVNWFFCIFHAVAAATAVDVDDNVQIFFYVFMVIACARVRVFAFAWCELIHTHTHTVDVYLLNLNVQCLPWSLSLLWSSIMSLISIFAVTRQFANSKPEQC